MNKRGLLSATIIIVTISVALGAVFLLTDKFQPRDKNSEASPTSTPSLTISNVSPQEAKKLIKDCQVKIIFQAHDSSISLTLKDGSVKNTDSSLASEIDELASDASSKCGFQIPKVIE